MATIEMRKAEASSALPPGGDARSIAVEAARRAGMSLRDWLDGVIAEQAGPKAPSVAPVNSPSFHQPRAKDHVSAGPLVQALREQIAALTSRAERIDAINADLQKLKIK